MKLLGRGSVAAFLKPTLDILHLIVFCLAIVIGVAALLVSIALALNMFAPQSWGLSELSLLFNSSSHVVWVFSMVVLFTHALVILFILRQLRDMFATLAAGDPFVPENATRLQHMAFAIAGLELIRFALSGIGVVVLAWLGQPDQASLSLTLRVSLGAWAGAVILLVLAEVFREGAALRLDRDLTI